MKPTVQISIASADLKAAIDRTNYACAAPKWESRPILQGILFAADHMTGTIRAIATDTHQMAIHTIAPCVPASDPASVPPFEFILHRKDALAVRKLLRANGRCSIAHEDTGTLRFVTEHGEHSCMAIDGTFPNWQRVVPQDFSFGFTVDRQALLDFTRQVMATKPKDNRVVFHAENDRLQVYSCVPEPIEFWLECCTKPVDRSELQWAINGRYLISILKALPEKTVSVRFARSRSGADPALFPLTITADNPTAEVNSRLAGDPVPGTTHIVMPMRVC